MNKIINPIPKEDFEFIMDGFNNSFDSNSFKEIGNGSFSVVYSYKDYAIKHYTEEECNDGEILEELGNSKWFPKLYFYNDCFMVVEKIDGITMDKLSCDNNYKYIDYNFNPISTNIVSDVLIKILFEKQYIANDIHGENVMITKDGRIVIVDVGLFTKHYRDEYFSGETNVIESYISQINTISKRNKVKKDAQQSMYLNNVINGFSLGNFKIEFKNGSIIKANV